MTTTTKKADYEKTGYYWDEFIEWYNNKSAPVIPDSQHKVYWDCWKKAIDTFDEDILWEEVNGN